MSFAIYCGLRSIFQKTHSVILSSQGPGFELATQLTVPHVLAGSSDSAPDIANWITISEQILLSRRQQIKPRGNDREQITRARQKAEALFASKPQPVSTPAVPESLTPTDRSTRKPRVLPVLSPTAPVRYEELESPAALEPQPMHDIPRSQFGRIRTLVKYGMTVAQVAEVYGAAVSEIERILRKA